METTPTIDSKQLDTMFRDCLFQDGEDHSSAVLVEGIAHNFGFHPGRMNGHKDEVSKMLALLPDEFQQSGGGGWSFLNACIDRNGVQWTDLHRSMEQLFCLGIGMGLVQLVSPRSMWAILPGGMPYYMVLDKAVEVAVQKTI